MAARVIKVCDALNNSGVSAESTKQFVESYSVQFKENVRISVKL